MKSHLSGDALLWLLLVNSLGQYWAIAARASLTNIQCTSFNKSFLDFTECRLRLVQRNLNEITIRVKLSEPLEDVSVHLQLMKKSNGYHPYLVNTKFDACKFMSTKNNPLINYLYDFVQPYTNVNHSCPYEHELVLKNLRIDQSLLNAATILPTGDYAFYTTYTVNNIKRAYIQLYVKYKEN